ncbi:hypothetical protein ACUXAV_000209 [Cupriavidus metallidurans]|jgi:hypothetical protein
MGWSLGFDEDIHFAARAANTVLIAAESAVNVWRSEERKV